MRIGIFYGPAGGAHKACSIALEERFVKLGHTVELLDISSGTSKGGQDKHSKVYAFFSDHFRFLSVFFNYFLGTSLGAFLFNRYMWFSLGKELESLLTEKKFDLIINNYPHYTYILRKANNKKAKLFNIVLDPFFVHRIWFDKDFDGIFLPHIDGYNSKSKLFRNYAKKVFVIGFPVREKFFTLIDTKPVKNTVLISGGGEGSKKILEISHEVAKISEDFKITVAVGKNLNLQKKVEEMEHRRIKYLPWTDSFPEEMANSEYIVTKAGASTSYECLMLNSKVIIYDQMLPQEKGIPEFLKKTSGAIYESNAKKIAKVIKEGNMVKKIPDFSKVDSAELIIKKILDLSK